MRMTREELEMYLGEDFIENSLKNFKRIYPEDFIIPMIWGINNSKSGIIVNVGDGFHVINDRVVSRFLTNFEDAEREDV